MGAGFWGNVWTGIKNVGAAVGDFLGDVTGFTDGKLGYQGDTKKVAKKAETNTKEVAKKAETATGAPVDTPKYKSEERAERTIDAELAKSEAGNVANNKAGLAMKNAKGAANSAGLGKFAAAQLMSDAAIQAGAEGYDNTVANEKSLATSDRAAANARAGAEENRNFTAAQNAVGMEHQSAMGAANREHQSAMNDVNNKNSLLLSGANAIADLFTE